VQLARASLPQDGRQDCAVADCISR
jgi:hypothetical protein